MPDCVVITRPLAQAGALARRVALMGREAVVFPLLEIHPLSDPSALRNALADLSGYAMVAFVSPNAIHATFAVVRDWPREVPLAVMGEGSRNALAQYGVTSANAAIVSPGDAKRTDSQTLLEALDIAALRGKRVLILRGETGRELLADAQNDWIVTSSESLRILVQMAQQVAGDSGMAKVQQQSIIMPHIRIQETAQALGFRNITLTGSGDEQLLAALQSRR
jgi:uroporphyrinogen-III synthase